MERFKTPDPFVFSVFRSVAPCLLALACVGARAASASVSESGGLRCAYGPAETDEDLKKIGEQSDAQELNLTGPKITDVGLAYLKGMKVLRILSLSATAVTDGGMSDLRDLKEIRELYLRDTRITDVGLKELAQSHPNLRILVLGKTRITDASMLYIGKMTDLIVLGLNSQITDADLKHIMPLTKLLEIGFDDNNRVGDTGMRYLSRLPKLHRLELGTCQVTDAGLECLKGRKTFTQLNIHSDQITDVGVAQLKGFKSINKLSLRSSQITDAGLAALEGVEISQLTIGGSRVTDAGLKHLQKVPGLWVLDLHWNMIRGEGLRYLEHQPERIGERQLSKLHSLALSGATDETLKYVARLKSIDALDLHNPRFTVEGIKELQELRGLRNITLFEVEPGKDADMIRPLLPDCAVLAVPTQGGQTKGH